MIETTKLYDGIEQYKELCQRVNRTPTYKGLALILNISPQTISNVVHGTFNGGHEYTDTPHAKRCIDNNDFDAVKGLFDETDTNPRLDILNTKKGR